LISDDLLPELFQHQASGLLTRGRLMGRVAQALPADDYFTPEARKLCARVKHKSELSDDETLMLALAAAQAALARYWHPGVRSAEETLEAIGIILDHEGVVAL
jgi:hypothetical protein